MGQAIQTLPVFLPGAVEANRFLVDVAQRGDASVFVEYLERMKADAGTPYDIGFGARFGRPSTDEVREVEEKYLSADAQRDYDNSPHAGEAY